MVKEDLKSWTELQVATLLQFDDVSDIVDLLFGMPFSTEKHEMEIKDYIYQLLGQSKDVEIFVDDFICRRRGNKERIKDGLNLQDQSSSNINSNYKSLVNLSKIDSFILSSSDEETKEKVNGRGKKSKGKKA